MLASLSVSQNTRYCDETEPGKRWTKKVADLPSQKFWLGGNSLNFHYRAGHHRRLLPHTHVLPQTMTSDGEILYSTLFRAYRIPKA